MLSNNQDIIERAEKIRYTMKTYRDTNEGNAEINNIRLEILSLIEEAINFYNEKSTFDLWRKDVLSHAMRGLLSNLDNNSNSNDATIWLEYALANIEYSTQDERSPLYPLFQLENKEKAEEIERLFTQNDFIKFIHKVRKEIKANS